MGDVPLASGNSELVRTAGRILGEAVAPKANLINSSIVVIGGDIADARESSWPASEVAHQRSLPLAAVSLELAASELGRRADVVGVAYLVADARLAPETADRHLSDPDSWSQSPSST